MKRKGFSMRAGKTGWRGETKSATLRDQFNIWAVYKRVDTCAAEFSPTPLTCTPLMMKSEANPTDQPRQNHGSGGGPNRIGQGIEFDYCCVHAAGAA